MTPAIGGPGQPARGASGFAFRPDIEGLRAVAVSLVVLLHAGVTAVSGGYVGVDVFFVISGFLITSLLVREVRSTNGVSVLAFYGRRARRILPVACLVIAVTVVAAYAAVGPLVGRSTAIDGRWSAVFAANFRFIAQGTDYFAQGTPPSPLQHYWSLAVEEQFYLVWPTLLLAVAVVGRRLQRPTGTLRVALIVGVGLSLAWSVHQTAINSTAAYFSPFTRAWELGLGALLATLTGWVERTPAPIRTSASWVGLGAILVAAFVFGPTTPFPGWVALLPVGGTVLLIAGGFGQPAGASSHLLSLRPLRWIGRISFSIYLWHWPVLIITEDHFANGLTPKLRVACVALTVVLATASYYLVERPFLSSPFLRSGSGTGGWAQNRRALVMGAATIAVAFGISSIVAVQATRAVVPVAEPTASGIPTRPISGPLPENLSPAKRQIRLERIVRNLVRRGLRLHSVPPDVVPSPLALRNDPRYGSCIKQIEDPNATPCTFGNPTAKRTLVVFGDSHAMSWMPALDTIARDSGFRLVGFYKIACPVPDVPTLSYRSGPYPQCREWRTRALAAIRRLDPEVVVTTYERAATSPNAFSTVEWERGLRRSMRMLRAGGARVAQIGDNPRLPEDPGLCLTRPNADPTACIGRLGKREVDAIERRTVESLGGVYIDIAPWFCAENRCPPIINRIIAYRDYQHLSPEYVTALEPLLAAALARAGVG